MSLFKTIEIDEETQILHFNEEVMDGLNVRFEIWVWDGIKGQSVIFIKKEVENKNETELVGLLENHIGDSIGKHTYADKGNGFVYINYGFET